MSYQDTSSKKMSSRNGAMKVMRRISDITTIEFDLDEFDPRQEHNGAVSCHGNINAKTSHIDTKKVMRQRISDITSDFDRDKFNLRQEYDGAVACLRYCEPIIKMLQERVASKDEIIASKDELIVSKDTQITAREEQIESLEEKIVQMSIDLASTKMEKDELQNELKRKDASDISSEAMVTLARYQPKSTTNLRKAHSDSMLKAEGRAARKDCFNLKKKPYEDYFSLKKKPSADAEGPKPLIVNFAHKRNSYVTPKDNLASTKTEKDELQNKLKRKEASNASSEAIVTLARDQPKSIANLRKAHSDSMLKAEGRTTRKNCFSFSLKKKPYEDYFSLKRKPRADAEGPKPLIVNFAHQRNSFVTPEDKRSVQFSPMEDIRFYERPEQAVVRKIFYEKEEYARMKKDRKQVVKDVQMKYISLSAGLHRPGDEVLRSCNLTGIENKLSPEIESDVARHRDECVRAVLKEQARQKDSGGCCEPERIAHLSQIRSAWAMKRARRVAVYHLDTAPKS